MVSLRALLVTSAEAYAQSASSRHWPVRALRTKSMQLGWSFPSITQYPYLIQVVRTDFVMQISAAHTTTCRPMEAVA